ncbi:hypothetical protein DKX38_027564 [Salix brachista]|uniref:NB-ARC domain-containing protein n=1 Tax=Salix brachista TaxID=2182728 RepID=A0A5N5J391_9ROSI|nr:hypothetical protein DKX38_027564 [Salix brachista]
MKVNDEHPRKTIKKVCSSMIFSCFCFREVSLRSHVARDIQTLNGRIDGIVSEKKKFHLKLSEGEIKPPEHKITTSVIDVTKFKGRETDRSTIVKMLLGESSDQEQASRTISLVGMGGIGKTTLAQLVYNDDEVETYFGKRIWVCVSEPFDEIWIAKAILEALVRSAPNLITLQALLERIQESIRGKRFLLVLDDVWNEDFTKWEQLKTSLKRGCLPGSRFLVTTRNTEVANVSSLRILGIRLNDPDGSTWLITLVHHCSLRFWLWNFGRQKKKVHKMADDGAEEVKKREIVVGLTNNLHKLFKIRKPPKPKLKAAEVEKELSKI